MCGRFCDRVEDEGAPKTSRDDPRHQPLRDLLIGPMPHDIAGDHLPPDHLADEQTVALLGHAAPPARQARSADGVQESRRTTLSKARAWEAA